MLQIEVKHLLEFVTYIVFYRQYFIIGLAPSLVSHYFQLIKFLWVLRFFEIWILLTNKKICTFFLIYQINQRETICFRFKNIAQLLFFTQSLSLSGSYALVNFTGP